MDYQRIYDQIIERAKTRQTEDYTEKHHIIPKCLNGNNDKNNLVRLTAREHFICHMLLCRIHPKNIKLKQALWLMAIQRYKNIKINNRLYERLRIEYINTIKNQPKHTEKSKEKIRQSRLNKRMSDESKLKLSQKKKGKIIKNIRIPINQYDMQGNFIKEWPSIMEAQKFYGKGDGIGQVCRNKQKTSYGFIWKIKQLN